MRKLTGREYDMAFAVHDGLSNKMIAHHYGISTTTVKVHLRSIYQKLGVTPDGRYMARVKLALWVERELKNGKCP